MGMITFNVRDNTAFDRMYNHYWFDADFIERTPHLTSGIVDVWMNYCLETYGIHPKDDGQGTWVVVDEQKYALLLLKWT